MQRGRHYWGFEKVSRGANGNQAGENTVLMIFVFDVMICCRTICCGVAFCELDLEFGCREEEEEVLSLFLSLSLSLSLSFSLVLSLLFSLSLCVCVRVRAAKRAFNVCLVKLKFLLLFSNKQTKTGFKSGTRYTKTTSRWTITRLKMGAI